MNTAPPAAPSPPSPALLKPTTPARPGERRDWSGLHGASQALALAEAARAAPGPLLVVAADTPAAERLEREIPLFAGAGLPVLSFPDWETLPYDAFSPHQDLISERLGTLHRLPRLDRGVLIVPMATLMQRLPPQTYLDAYSLHLKRGERLNLTDMRDRLARAGYTAVNQVMEHGEFAIRGGLLDLFPMGSDTPFRVELFDDEVDSIRRFDPDTQRSQESLPGIDLLPGREFPLNTAAIERFYQRYMEVFEANPARSTLYRELQAGRPPAGVEFYLPLFFETTATLFDYLPPGTLIAWQEGCLAAGDAFWATVRERYTAREIARDYPPLPPAQLYLDPAAVFAAIKRFAQVALRDAADEYALPVAAAPALPVDSRAARPLAALEDFIAGFAGRTLIAAESLGRRETLREMLARQHIGVQVLDDWAQFLASEARLAIAVVPVDDGLLLPKAGIAIVAESQIYGEHVVQQRRRERRETDPEAIIRNLTELAPGDPVVHIEHGVGRYLGLETLDVGGSAGEYLALEYADRAKIYVPVGSLELVHRYTGADATHAPLHKLGSGDWQRAQRKAREQVRDAAAELLAIYAKRAARGGHAIPLPDDYARFAASFPFEETPDQARAIADVLADLAAEKPMDRVVCGDVGFGKTEVAVRAAFVAAHAGQQVAVLVPTTLLAQQHAETFRNRLADWPLRVAALTRFESKAEQQQILAQVAAGQVDIVIGTHRLLQKDVAFQRLGLLIIDEEHRFGVKQKEAFKALRAEVDVLTLTATPIPRTLSLAMSGLRDLSIIATPPPRRMAVKTFVRPYDGELVREACLREFKRGGQVYFLHNKVETIERVAHDLRQLLPEAALRVAHGQMPERELERIMADFHHRRFNLLVCTTIVESGIDVPTANTIVIDRADNLGLAQLHQLRGRVGRSHHQAYAYLMVPSRDALKGDALKRLEAIESLGELGIGFTLASHDMEIRGAGELLGDEQTGHIQEIGFTLFNELLERAVRDIRAGRTPDFDAAVRQEIDINLGGAALLPGDYVPDVHQRLVLYKRVAGAADLPALEDLQVELVDRFGPLPPQAGLLFVQARLRIAGRALGVTAITGGEHGFTVALTEQPAIDVDALLKLIRGEPKVYRFDGRSKLVATVHTDTVQARLDAVQTLLERLRPDTGAQAGASVRQ